MVCLIALFFLFLLLVGLDHSSRLRGVLAFEQAGLL